MNTTRTDNQIFEQDNRAYWREHVYDYGDYYRPRHEVSYWRAALVLTIFALAAFYWLP